MVKISLVGYGKMGHEIERLASLDRREKVVSIIDPVSNGANFKNLSVGNINGADVVIDFSSPLSIMDNINFYIDNNLKAVIGTTGWFDKISAVKNKIKNSKSTIIYSGNYSLCVAAFMNIAKYASSLFSKIGGYDSGILELHHNQKLDSPSGTAQMIFEAINNGEKPVEETLHRKKGDDEIQIASLRCGKIFGIHEVIFDDESNTVELIHRLKSRSALAQGALKAAEWLSDKKSGLYTLDDFTKDLFKSAKEVL